MNQEIGNKDETTKAIISSFEDMLESDLQALGMFNRVGQLRSATKIIHKKVLMEEVKVMVNTLARQCQEYSERFTRCHDSGLPHIFDANGDVYARENYMYKLEITRKDEAFLNVIVGEMGAKDVNLAVKNNYEVVTSLRYVFADPIRPSYQKCVDLSLTTNNAEEYKYPLKKEWNSRVPLIPKQHTSGKSREGPSRQ